MEYLEGILWSVYRIEGTEFGSSFLEVMAKVKVKVRDG